MQPAFYPVESFLSDLLPLNVVQNALFFFVVRCFLWQTRRNEIIIQRSGDKSEPRSNVKTWFLVEHDMDLKYFRMHETFETCRCIIYKDVKNPRIRMYDQLSEPTTKRDFFFSDAKVIPSYKLFYFRKNLYLNQFLKNLLKYANSINTFIPLSILHIILKQNYPHSRYSWIKYQF